MCAYIAILIGSIMTILYKGYYNLTLCVASLSIMFLRFIHVVCSMYQQFIAFCD